ncbi:hypothetical protein ASA1KI_36920 [Opitutales bacterium ASA1]|uniref:hypothetical protein n=1 Tax=Congregicoccus parvus TaxID=3081749 RepID=UPI002B2E244A|nr:hypothetical protein ASA1KI_36920 [Opitutales bacterium ASA1]
MKRTFVVLVAGLVAGLLAHTAWYSVRAPRQPDRLEEQLAWMRADLELSRSQFAQLKALHESLRPRLLQLADEVERMRIELARFEAQRIAEDQIDFVAFARLVRDRRAVDLACDASTQHLVDASLEVLSPEQRRRYLDLVSPAVAPRSTASF